MALRYLDFELSIEALNIGYRARVLNAPGSPAAVSDFTLPFSDVELENLVLKLSQTARSTRSLDSPAGNAAKVLGGGLFESVFKGQMATCLSASMASARAQGKGLRLRLRLHSADLMNLPWELLYRRDLNQFLGLAIRTPIIRAIDIPEPIERVASRLPLRIIAVVSQPTGLSSLDTERELKALEQGLREPIERSVVLLKVLPKADLNLLRRELKNEYHVLHFIGHGVFDAQAQDGVILFENDTGSAVSVTGQQLGTILRNCESLRLVVLNSCEGARTGRDDPFAGMAQSLLQAGLPAVIGMQFEISDRAALAFAGDFYTALAEGYPIDTALVESRTAVFSSLPGIEWATPVLYMRSSEGNLFEFAHAASERPKDSALSPGASGRASAPMSTAPAHDGIPEPPTVSFKEDATPIDARKWPAVVTPLVWAAGSVTGVVTGQTLADILQLPGSIRFLVFGIGLALAQWILAADRVLWARRWAIATFAGAAVGALLSEQLVMAILKAGFGAMDWQAVALYSARGLVMGLAIGVCQWVSVRRVYLSCKWIVVISSAAWMCGSALMPLTWFIPVRTAGFVVSWAEVALAGAIAAISIRVLLAGGSPWRRRWRAAGLSLGLVVLVTVTMGAALEMMGDAVTPTLEKLTEAHGVQPTPSAHGPSAHGPTSAGNAEETVTVSSKAPIFDRICDWIISGFGIVVFTRAIIRRRRGGALKPMP